MYSTQSYSWSYSGSILSYGVGDFDRNGVLDFAFGGPATPFQNVAVPFMAISIARDGVIYDSSSIMTSIPRAIHAREMFIGDLNGDNVDDFYSGNHGYDAAPFPGEVDTLMLSDKNGHLVDVSKSLPQHPTFTHSVTGGDIDSDGDTDLFVGVLGWYNTGPYLLINNGRGVFTQRDAGLPDKIGSGVDQTGRFTASLLADINNDGSLDIVVGSEEHGPTAGMTYLNDGNGYFSEVMEKT